MTAPVRRDPRAIAEPELRHAPAPAARHEFRVFVAEAAFDRATAHGDADTAREVGGVLVGELARDDAGPYLVVTDTIDALHADEQGAEVTFTHATWDHIHAAMERDHAGKRVVGWYHTHPGFGVFLSDRDQFIHTSFFDLPFQIALVYDPKAKDHGVFGWHDGALARMRRYWIGDREQAWDGARDPGGAAAAATPAPEPPAAPGRDPGDPGLPASTMSLIVVGVVCVLLGGLIGHWLAGGSGRGGDPAVAARASEDAAARVASALDTELIGLLRDTLGDAAVQRPVAAAIAEVDAAIAALEQSASGSGAGSGASAGVARLKHAREALHRLADDRSSAEAALARLARAGGDRRELADQRAGLGQLYAELAHDAQRAGDAARARRLLAAAAHYDPANRARYDRQLRGLDERGGSTGGAGARPGHDAGGSR